MDQCQPRNEPSRDARAVTGPSASWDESEIVCRHGIALRARRYGDGDHTLVCLPGLARTQEDFRGIAAALPEGWGALCPDHRGRGASDRDPRPSRYHTDTYARDALEWLERLGPGPEYGSGPGPGRIVALGNSFGGWVAARLARLAPERVDGVVLNDIGATVPRDAALQYMAMMSRPSSARNVDPSFHRQMRQAHRLAPLLGLLCRLGFLRHSAPVVTGYGKTLRELRTPLLVVRGARSRVLTREGLAELRALRPDLDSVEVEGAGHTPTLTEPETVRALRAFLDRIATPA